MTTMNDILTELDELWDDAERGTPAPGDIVIEKSRGTGYAVFDWLGSTIPRPHDRIRVLGRAKPKAPEWQAVVASFVTDADHEREVYFLTSNGVWESDTHAAYSDELVDPVPLVEMPSHRELMATIKDALGVSRGLDSDIAAGAVLELLRGDRKA